MKEADAMGLFTKYCTLCGMKIEKHQDSVKFGKHFYSKQHADLYSKQKKKVIKRMMNHCIKVMVVAE